jgi:hypothetical protein
MWHPFARTEGGMMAKKTIKARELLNDIRAGMDDESLMLKYGLSAKGVFQAINRLIWVGLMAPSELAERKSLAKTVYMPIFKCSFCGDIQFERSDKCPRCGSFLKNVNEKKSSSD